MPLVRAQQSSTSSMASTQPPTARPSGSPLIEGDEWFNTTDLSQWHWSPVYSRWLSPPQTWTVSIHNSIAGSAAFRGPRINYPRVVLMKSFKFACRFSAVQNATNKWEALIQRANSSGNFVYNDYGTDFQSVAANTPFYGESFSLLNYTPGSELKSLTNFALQFQLALRKTGSPPSIEGIYSEFNYQIGW